MGANARAAVTLDVRCRSASDSTRERLVRTARSLPESDLKTAILATLAEREPTAREALVWIALLQRPIRVPLQV